MKKQLELHKLRDSAKKMLKSEGPNIIQAEDFSLEQAIEEINIYHIELEMQVEELQQNRTELEKNKKYLKFLFDYAPIGYIVLNKDGYILDANFAALSYFEYEKDLFMEYRLQSFVTADTYADFHKCIRALNDLQISQHTELRFRKKSTSMFWARVDLSFHPDIIDEQMILCSILDITQQKNAEKALKEKQAQLTHADRLSSLGEMATGMAHELNQPLSRIRVNAQGIQILLDKLKNIPSSLFDKFNNRMNAIIKEVDRAALIIEHMRGFAHSKCDQKMMNIREPIESSLSFFQEQFKHHNIKLKTNFEDNLPEINVDPQLIEQIIVNLLSNARYAVDKKEKNMSDTQNLETRYEKIVNISLYEEANKFIILKVSDNGIGMTQHEKHLCMDPFYTTKTVGEGTGLGLSIVRNIVKEFFGAITIESEKNYGTDVLISFTIK
ncbi:PAS/PAC sensor signal transduction histidine kinase [Candidatus Magnetomorum sp. HK-1]|nr:PAS/PAC sensor signal transduction histidine kinase [Candidatus Magnetomorum sp. HK-1]